MRFVHCSKSYKKFDTNATMLIFQVLTSSFNPLLYIPYLLLIGWIIFTLKYYSRAKADYKNINLYWLDSIPSIFTTLGVFGTFFGIAIALSAFNPNDIDASLPPLLDGMKTAFWTSIIGIGLSLISQKMIQAVQYQNESTEDTSNDPLERVSSGLKALKEAISGEQEGSLSNHMVQLRLLMKDELKPLKDIKEGVGGTGETSLLTQIQRLREDHNEELKVITELHSGINNQHKIVNEQASKFDSNQKEQLEITKSINEESKKLNGLMDSTHQIMNENSKLIDRKFSEFTKLLEKANTDALTEAIKSVIGDFNNKLNELIDRLVKENFEELNRSVNSLNEWQKQNKEQVAALILQFEKVSNDLTISSETLERTANSSEKLVAEDSKLAKLIQELYEVVQEDQKFKDAIIELHKTTTKLGESSIEMKDSMTKASSEMKETMTGAGSELKNFMKEASSEWKTSLEGQKSYNLEFNQFMETFKDRNERVVDSLNQVTKNLSTDSDILKTIAEKTQNLVENDSKLAQLLKQFELLSKDDNGFIQASDKLGKHAGTLDEVSGKMEKWAENQAGVENAVRDLVDKLSEIEQLRNQTDGFFNDVKDQFSDAAGILKGANESHKEEFERFGSTLEASINQSFQSLDAVLKQTILEYARRLKAIDGTRNN